MTGYKIRYCLNTLQAIAVVDVAGPRDGINPVEAVFGVKAEGVAGVVYGVAVTVIAIPASCRLIVTVERIRDAFEAGRIARPARRPTVVGIRLGSRSTG